MTLYAFELSGEHPTLPRSEALALLGICSCGYAVAAEMDRCLVVEARDPDLGLLGTRLAMTHRVIQVLAITEPSFDALKEAAKDAPIPRQPYKLRAKRLGRATLPNDQVEKEVGSVLWARGYKADMRCPEIELRVLTTEDRAILGRVLVDVDRGSFQERRPHLKPFFHPGAMGPRMARALVNLSLAGCGDRLLDPFAGTGGFLVEAGLVGIRGIGVDAQEEMVRGARANLVDLGCDLVLGDARRLPFREGAVEAAVADAPYGRSARIQAGSRDELVCESLAELHRVLIPGRRMIFVDDRPIREMITKAGFAIIEHHKERVHRSLTRHIFVCER